MVSAERTRPLLYLALLSLVAAIGLRMTAPSDLYDQDQPKTIAYTVDMAEHGRWLLPVDNLGRPATKPPMYNWLGVAFYAAAGPAEWVFKAPSLVAAVVVFGGIVWIGRRLPAGATREDGSPLGPAGALAVAAIAAALWPANYAGSKLIYLARPDMPLTAFLTIAWIAATLLLCGDESGAGESGDGDAPRRPSRIGLQFALWLAVAGAALTKGIPALLVVAYVIVGARLIGGRWAAVTRTGVVWGLPLAVALFGAWLAGAFAIQPQHAADIFLGDETVDRIGGEGVGQIIGDVWKMPAWFLARFAPWSLLVVLTLVHIPVRRWMRHPLGPAILWVLITIVFFSLSAGKRADYLAPAYPAASILAAYWLVVVGAKHRLRPVAVAVVIVGVSIGLGIVEYAYSPAAKTMLGEHAAAFARQVGERVGHDEPIVFIDTGYGPMQALLGRNQGADVPTREQLEGAVWVVRPVSSVPGGEPVVTSEPIRATTRVEPRVLGLYPASPATIAVEPVID